MSPPSPEKTTHRSIFGAIFGASAFLIWGISPLYWKTLTAVPALEIVAHRVIWSFLLLMPLILFRKRWKEFLTGFNKLALHGHPDSDIPVCLLQLARLYLGHQQWISAAGQSRLLHQPPRQCPAGHPVFEGASQILPRRLAVLLAGAGVLYLTMVYGQFPWIACILALTFGIYGLIRKVIAVGSLVGLTIETLLLTAPALAYLIYRDMNHSAAFFNGPLQIDLLLIGTSVVTALPLLLFAMCARRVRLTTLGFLQYIAPSCMFVMAVFVFLEPFEKEQLISFILIWTALAVYSSDSLVHLGSAGNAH